MSLLGCKVGLKKIGVRSAALGTRTVQILSQSSPSSNRDLGDLVSPSSQLSCSVLGVGVGVGLGPAPRGCKCPGSSTLQVHAVPQTWKLFAPVSLQAQPLAVSVSRNSLFPVSPAGTPGSALRCPLVPRCEEGTLRSILPPAEKRFTYPSFSPWSFLLLRSPDIAAHE